MPNGAKTEVNHYFKHAGAMQIRNTVYENGLLREWLCMKMSNVEHTSAQNSSLSGKSNHHPDVSLNTVVFW